MSILPVASWLSAAGWNRRSSRVIMQKMDKNTALSLAPLKKAVLSLEKALAQAKDEFSRDSVIQCFEYTYELCWKSLKRYFFINAQLEESNVKNLFREAARQGLIDDLEAWFGFHKARNLTSHTYNEDTAEEVYAAARKFAAHARALLAKLEPLA